MIRNESEIFEFDVDDVVAEFDGIEQTLRVLAEYDESDFTNLYVTDDVLEEFGGKRPFLSENERVEAFLRTDLLERDTYSAIVPRAGRAELFVTKTENQVFVRVFDGDRALFASVDNHGSIDAITDILRTAIDAT